MAKSKKPQSVLERAHASIAKANKLLGIEQTTTTTFERRGVKVKVLFGEDGAPLMASAAGWLRQGEVDEQRDLDHIEDQISAVMTAASVPYLEKKKAAAAGALGGRPKSEYPEEWATEFLRRRALTDELSDDDIYRNIARVWFDDKGEPRAWTTIRNAAKKYLLAKKGV